MNICSTIFPLLWMLLAILFHNGLLIKVTAEIQWALKHDPYCCADNMDRKPIEDVISSKLITLSRSVVAPLLMPQGLSLSDEMRRHYEKSH